jgi:Flp pilus assembly protein TadD
MERYSKPSPKPQVLPIGLLLADLQQQQGQQQQAVATYSKLAGDFPRDPRPLLALALLKQEQGDTKGAQETMAQARSRQPENKDPRLDRVASNWGMASLESSKEPSPKASTKPAQAAPTP